MSAKISIDTTKGRISPDSTATLVQMVRDALERMTPMERVAFFNRASAGYCLECGEPEPHDVCPFMLDETPGDRP